MGKNLKSLFVALCMLLGSFNAFSQDCNVNTSLTITADSPICLGSMATVTIQNPEIDVLYEVVQGTTVKGSVIVTGGSASSSFVSFEATASGVSNYQVRATKSGCSPVLLSSSVNVVVNAIPRQDLHLNRPFVHPLCQPINSLGIYSEIADPGVTYQAYRNGIAVGKPMLASTYLLLSVPGTALELGHNEFTITATVPGCPSVTLVEKYSQEIKVPAVSKKTNISATNVCKGNSVNVTILDAETDAQYDVRVNETWPPYKTVTAPSSGNLSIEVGSDVLTKGQNSVKIIAVSCDSLFIGNFAVNVAEAVPDVAVVVGKDSVWVDNDTVRVDYLASGTGINKYRWGVSGISEVKLKYITPDSSQIMALFYPNRTNTFEAGALLLTYYNPCTGSFSEPISYPVKVYGSKPEVTTFSPEEGSVGTQVTITGINLDQVTSVTIGGVNAEFSTVDNQRTEQAAQPLAKKLVVTVPEGANTGAIVVSGSTGTFTTSTNFKVSQTTAVGDELLASQFVVYPNPSEGVVNILSDAKGTTELTVLEIVSGAVVYSEVLQGQSNQVNLSQLQSGTYILTLKTQAGNVVRKKIELY